MAWYYGTFSCGCDGRTNVIGPGKNRQWIIDKRFGEPCQDCKDKTYAENIEKARIAAEKAAVEMELPELTGTEKQIAWAVTLRQNMLDSLDKVDKNALECINATEDDKIKVAEYIFTQTKASWFIDNRTSLFLSWMETVLPEVRSIEPAKAEIKVELDIKAESTVVPQNAVTSVVAEITVKDDMVSVKFEKNEKFRELVKLLGYKWDGIWQKSICETTGLAADRAAELGNNLLNTGFPIMIMDAEIRQNAIDGKFEPECNRWIYVRAAGKKHEGKFAINWAERSDSLYKKARSLPGSIYDSPSVIVRIEHYKEVQDFAQLFGFKFTKAAIKAIEAQKEKEAGLIIVNPAKVEKVVEMDKLSDILNTDDGILDDLKDD